MPVALSSRLERRQNLPLKLGIEFAGALDWARRAMGPFKNTYDLYCYVLYSELIASKNGVLI